KSPPETHSTVSDARERRLHTYGALQALVRTPIENFFASQRQVHGQGRPQETIPGNLANCGRSPIRGSLRRRRHIHGWNGGLHSSSASSRSEQTWRLGRSPHSDLGCCVLPPSWVGV